MVTSQVIGPRHMVNHRSHKNESPALRVTRADIRRSWDRGRMQVIRAQLANLSEAARLFAAYREFYGEPYDLEVASSFLASRLARDESIVLLVQDGDATVGFTQIYPSFSSTRLAPVWVLNDLFVIEEARGSGAVDAILDAAATLAAEAGAIAIKLATAHTNVRAQAVYQRHGYQEDTTYKHYEKPLT